MGHPMKHEHGWHGSHESSGPMMGGMSPLFIPAPMAMFGAIVAFMFGWTMGSMVGRKQAMMMSGGGKSWKGMGHWKGGGMGMSHHHHGYGAPACKEQHGDWQGEDSGEMAED